MKKVKQHLVLSRETLRIVRGGSPNASENTECVTGSSRAPWACPSDACPTVGPCDRSFGPCG